MERIYIPLITMVRFTFNQFDWFMDKEEMAKKDLNNLQFH
jgi:hypothetical protein